MEEQNKSNTEAKSSFLKNPLVILSIIFILGWIIGWVIHSQKINKMEQQIAQIEQTSRAERVLIIENTKEILRERDSLSMKLFMKPLIWAIRAEMLRDNMEQVNQYENQLVKEKNFNLIMVISTDGTIISSTDKKLEGSDFASLYESKYLDLNEINTTYVDSSIIHVTAPILGYNNKLGTLFIEYQRPYDPIISQSMESSNP